MRWIMGFCLVTFFNLYANAQTQPKFSIDPLTATAVNVPSNSNIQVRYRVTNNTKITRTLTMESIVGVSQVTTSGYCTSPFTLAHNQSCVLALQIDGEALAQAGRYYVFGGPKICKTQGSGSKPANSFLCSQPSQANSLDISVFNSSETAVISVSGSPVSLLVNGSSQNLTITNLSLSVTATGITSTFSGALVGAVSESANTCSTLAPGSSCTITYTPASTAVGATTFSVAGGNTNTVSPTMSIQLTLSNCIYDGGSQTLVCTSSGGLTQLGGDIYRHYTGACSVTGAIFNVPGTVSLSSTTYVTSPISGVIVGCDVSLCNTSDCGDLETTSTLIN